MTGLLAAIAAPIAFLTGRQAEEVAESLSRLSEEAIEHHEHWLSVDEPEQFLEALDRRIGPRGA